MMAPAAIARRAASRSRSSASKPARSRRFQSRRRSATSGASEFIGTIEPPRRSGRAQRGPESITTNLSMTQAELQLRLSCLWIPGSRLVHDDDVHAAPFGVIRYAHVFGALFRLWPAMKQGTVAATQF